MLPPNAKVFTPGSNSLDLNDRCAPDEIGSPSLERQLNRMMRVLEHIVEQLETPKRKRRKTKASATVTK